MTFTLLFNVRVNYNLNEFSSGEKKFSSGFAVSGAGLAAIAALNWFENAGKWSRLKWKWILEAESENLMFYDCQDWLW